MKLFGFHVPFTQRANGPNVNDDRWFTPVIEMGQTTSGIEVTPETALRFSAIFACVKVIGETLASLPLITYKRLQGRGKERADSHPLYSLLKTKPNRIMTSFEFREMLTTHVLLRGNGYAQIIRNRAGNPIELWPLHPTRVLPRLNSEGNKVYEYRLANGQTAILAQEDVLHVKGLGDSGLTGLSPIAYSREAIGMALAAENFGGKFFANGGVPSAVLEFKDGSSLSPEAFERLKQDWDRTYGGGKAAGKTVILESGLSFKPISVAAEDAQYIETRKFQVEEIARIYRVPLHMVGSLDKATFSNIEQQSLDFVQYCMLPWLRRWEEALVRDLLGGDDRQFFAEFLVDALLRGDFKSRYEGYAIARNWGVLSANDIREKENMNPIPEGDIYLQPLNMVPAGTEPQNEGGPKQEPTEKKSDVVNVREAIYPAIKETWQRVVRKEIRSVKHAAQNKGDGFSVWFEKFKEEHRAFADECLKPLAGAVEGLLGRSKDEYQSVLADYLSDLDQEVRRFYADPMVGYARDESKVADEWAGKMLAA